MLTQVAQAEVETDVAYHFNHRRCEQNLTAVTGRHDARDAVEGMRDGIVIASPFGRADVNAHPNAQGASLAPSLRWLVMQGSLSSNGRTHRLLRQVEGGLEGVADNLEDM